MKTNLFRKKGLIRAFTAVMTSVFLAMVFVATPAMGATADIWNISKSKTATNLDENYESKVTLSLPSAEEELVSDIVFVMDGSSCEKESGRQVLAMLDSLSASIEKSNATIKVGVVKFRAGVNTFDLAEYNADTKAEIESFMQTPVEKRGSNLHAGLRAGEAMLGADSSVADSRKYMVVVSDGVVYLFDDETTPEYDSLGVNYVNRADSTGIWQADAEIGIAWKGNAYVPADWSTWLNEVSGRIDATVKDKATVYDRSIRGNQEELAKLPCVGLDERDQYVSTGDVAMYKAYEVYQRIAGKYHVNAVCSETNDYHPRGASFMKWLGGENAVDFDGIQKEIYYLLDAGSQVVDVMGNDIDDKGNEYDFDFVNDIDALELTVNGKALDKTKIDENTYGFGKTDAGYKFELTYHAKGTDAVEGEHFVWNINVPVSNFEPVALTYTVQLTNPQTKAGTYGEFDATGANQLSGLYTNNSATLYPVDTNQTPGAAEDFAKPTVSYTVAEQPVEPEKPEKPVEPTKPSKPTKKPSGNLPQTGDAVMAAVVLTGLVGAGAGVAYVSRRRA